MRRSAAPPPDAAALEVMPVHRVVRVWPETLATLREAGVDLKARGADPLGGLPDAAALVRRCLAATAWRGGAR